MTKVRHQGKRPERTYVRFRPPQGPVSRPRRHERGLTQEQLAHAAGLTRFHYQQLEKGQSKPGLRNIIALTQALGATLEELLPSEVPDVTEGR